MFTIVNYPKAHHYRRDASEPRPEIINHRNDPDSKRWSEKLRNEEITYKHLKQHRDELLESEIRYKKTIQQLEKEKAELIKIYEPTYEENKVLKSLLEHGPDAVKMKKLRKAKKELGEEVDTLKDDNKRLTEQMQELLKTHAPARDDLLEQNWQDVLVESKKTKENNETTVTQGPFSTKGNGKSKKVSEKQSMKEDDEYDLQLDTVEKEIKILLNNVKYIKKQKEKLDYAILMSKGAIVRNSVLEKSIYDKLDKDLTNCKSELDIAKSKHDDIKEQIEQKEINQKLKTVPLENCDCKTVSEQSIIKDQPKTYITRETQTENSNEFKITELDQDTPKTKRTRKPQANIAIQTDFPNILSLKHIKLEATKHIEQYENSKSKIQDAKLNVSKKVSSTQTRKIYARKLVVRQKGSTFKDHTSNDILKQMNKELLNKEDESPKKFERPTYTQKRKYKTYVLKGDESTGKVERTAISEEKINRLKAAKINEFPSAVEKSVNNQRAFEDNQQPNQKVKNVEETVPMKLNLKERITMKNASVENLPNLKNTNMPNARLDFPKSKIESKSVDHLRKDQVMYDYEDKIMSPKANVLNPTSKNGRVQNLGRERNSYGNLNRSRVKSKSSLEINQTSKHTRIQAKKHRIPVNLPSIDRISVRPGSIDSWKSESDLPIFSDSEADSLRPIKDFKLVIRRNNNYMHLTGVINEEVSKKRDESAYDEVLYDLQNQKMQSARDVSEEFIKTVNDFREQKDVARERQKLKIKNNKFHSDILPQATLTFTERPIYTKGKYQK